MIGDILSVQSGIIVHGCNAQGMMGAGLALQVRRKYPGCFDRYQIEHERFDRLDLGSVVWYRVHDDLWIANAITQKRCGAYANLVAIGKCFDLIATHAEATGLHVHYPRIGCGIGGLSWSDVQPVINHSLQDVPNTLWELHGDASVVARMG